MRAIILLSLLASCSALGSSSGKVESPVVLTVTVSGFRGQDAWAIVKTDVLDKVIVVGEADVVVSAALRGSQSPLWSHELRAGPADWWLVDGGESHHFPFSETPMPTEDRDLYTAAEIAAMEARGFPIRFEGD